MPAKYSPLKILGVDKTQILKCCAHLLLTVDDAIESRLVDAERKIGRDVLIDVSKVGGPKFNCKNSIVVQGLLAFCKALSPSHCHLSYSLYMKLKRWCILNNIDAIEFKAFNEKDA